eukprot:jgi/Mesvir1/11221/Mv03068-RA.2
MSIAICRATSMDKIRCIISLIAVISAGVVPADGAKNIHLNDVARVPDGAIVTLYEGPNYRGRSVSFGCKLDPRDFRSAIKFKVNSVRIQEGCTAWITKLSAASIRLAAGHSVFVVQEDVPDVDTAWEGGVIGLSSLCAAAVKESEECPLAASWPNAPCVHAVYTADEAKGHPAWPAHGQVGAPAHPVADKDATTEKRYDEEAPEESKEKLYEDLLTEAISLLRSKHVGPGDGGRKGSTGGPSKRGAGDRASAPDEDESPDPDEPVFEDMLPEASPGPATALPTAALVPAASDAPAHHAGVVSGPAHPAPAVSAPGRILKGCLDHCPDRLSFESAVPPASPPPASAGLAPHPAAHSRRLLHQKTKASALHRLGVVIVYCADKEMKHILEGLSCDTVDVFIYSKCGNQPSVPSKLEKCTTVNSDERTPAGMNALSIFQHLSLHYDTLAPVTVFLKDTLPHGMVKHMEAIMDALTHHPVGYYAFSKNIRDVFIQDVKDTYMRTAHDTEFTPTILNALRCGNASPRQATPARPRYGAFTVPVLKPGRGANSSTHVNPKVTPGPALPAFLEEKCKQVGGGVGNATRLAETRTPGVLQCDDPLESGWATDRWRSAVHSVFAVARNRVWMWPKCKVSARRAAPLSHPLRAALSHH